MAVTTYTDRFLEAMKLSGMDTTALAAKLRVTYQAIKKVENGDTKMLTAENNLLAARAMNVDPEWLAIGDGTPRGTKVWPFTHDLLEACRAAISADKLKAENAARNVLDMPPLPKQETLAKSA